MFSQAVRQNALSDASKLYAQMNAAATPNNMFAVKDRASTPTSKIPVPLGSAQPDDMQMYLRSQVVNDQGQVPGYGMAVADERVFDYIERKKEAEIEADFKSWVMAQADFSDPARAEFWNRVAPWISDLKIQEMEKNAELQKRLAAIKIKGGPTSEDDMKLLYMIRNGVVRMPSKPLHEMGEDTVYYQDKDILNFKRGLFNPLATAPPLKGLAPAQLSIPTRWNNSLPVANGANQFANWQPAGQARSTTTNYPGFLLNNNQANGLAADQLVRANVV